MEKIARDTLQPLQIVYIDRRCVTITQGDNCTAIGNGFGNTNAAAVIAILSEQLRAKDRQIEGLIAALQAKANPTTNQTTKANDISRESQRKGHSGSGRHDEAQAVPNHLPRQEKACRDKDYL